MSRAAKPVTGAPAADMLALWDDMRMHEAITVLFPHLQRVRPRAKMSDSAAVRVQVGRRNESVAFPLADL